MLAVCIGNYTNTKNSKNSFHGSKICKRLTIEKGNDENTNKLKKLLSQRVAGLSLKGCRYDKDGTTIPFTSNQVHGYTLEHACGIQPNSNHDGDIYGIELKCFTAKKLSLITTEADGGLYKSSFPLFMKKYGRNGLIFSLIFSETFIGFSP